MAQWGGGLFRPPGTPKNNLGGETPAPQDVTPAPLDVVSCQTRPSSAGSCRESAPVPPGSVTAPPVAARRSRCSDPRSGRPEAPRSGPRQPPVARWGGRWGGTVGWQALCGMSLPFLCLPSVGSVSLWRACLLCLLLRALRGIRVQESYAAISSPLRSSCPPRPPPPPRPPRPPFPSALPKWTLNCAGSPRRVERRAVSW